MNKIDLIFAVDPGTTDSAFTIWNPNIPKIENFGKVDNKILLDIIKDFEVDNSLSNVVFAIEELKSYGMALGDSSLKTVFWSGRFYQKIKEYSGSDVYLVPRKTIVCDLCGVAKAKDGNVVSRLKDLFGGKGTKKAPGFFYGVSKDVWQSTALALYISNLLGYNYEEKYRIV